MIETTFQRDVFNVIKTTPGLYTSQVVDLLKASRECVEDAIWELWSEGKIQMETDSRLRVTREGEKVFRHFAP
jgi:Mn-dependent DtxR family transcriptional regulator